MLELVASPAKQYALGSTVAPCLVLLNRFRLEDNLVSTRRHPPERVSAVLLRLDIESDILRLVAGFEQTFFVYIIRRDLSKRQYDVDIHFKTNI